MNCLDCRETLTALIDQELSSGERNSVESHLSTCIHCRKEYDSLLFAFSLTDKADSIPLDPSVWEQVEFGVASSRNSRGQSQSLFQMLLARHWRPAAAVVGAVGASIVLFSSLSDSGTDQVLEAEFTEFIRVREEISRQNRKELLEALERRDHRGVNPFVRPISLERGNPFRE